MKVGNDVVRIGLLCIGWCNRVSDARKPTNGEQHDQTDRKLHGRGKDQLSTPQRECPVDNLYAGWNCDCHGCNREHGDGNWAEARCEHVVSPYAPTHETNRCTREHHERITKQRLARKHWEHFRNDAEAWKDEDVHLGMAEDPEQVLPQERIGAGSDIEECCTEVALERKQEECDSNNGHCEQQQELHNKLQPSEYRHAHELHSRSPHVEHRGDQVDRTSQR